MNTIEVYNLSGKCVDKFFIPSADAACKQYKAILADAKNLPGGYGVTVVRRVDGILMEMETVIGSIILPT